MSHWRDPTYPFESGPSSLAGFRTWWLGFFVGGAIVLPLCRQPHFCDFKMLCLWHHNASPDLQVPLHCPTSTLNLNPAAWLFPHKESRKQHLKLQMQMNSIPSTTVLGSLVLVLLTSVCGLRFFNFSSNHLQINLIRDAFVGLQRQSNLKFLNYIWIFFSHLLLFIFNMYTKK